MRPLTCRLSGVGSPPAKVRCALTRFPPSSPDAARAWFFLARSRTVNVPAAANVADTGEPVSGSAPPSKFQASVSPLPLPEKVPCAPAVSVVGALPIVPFGKTTVTGTVWDVLRPPLHAENGRNAAAGMLVPFRLTLSVPSSNPQAASSRRLTGPLVPIGAAVGRGAA